MQCFSVTLKRMSNITLTMPAELIRQAKILAAQRDTSVSALVASLLASAVGDTADDAAVWDREAEVMASGILHVGPVTWSRDEVHAR
jgi:hypothetical protein